MDSFELSEKLFNIYSNVNAVEFQKRKIISSGISEFPVPELYNEQKINQVLVNNYYSPQGNRLLLTFLKAYSQLYQNNMILEEKNYGDWDVCVTVGASTAIQYTFEYIKSNFENNKIMMLGLNYNMFYRCVNIYNFDLIQINNPNIGRILPDVKNVIDSVRKERPILLILAVPANPSGEIYSDDETKQLINTCKEYGCYILYDRCQMDEFNPYSTYINFENLLLQYDYFHKAFIINSLSKTRSLPGARLGYAYGNKDYTAYITKRIAESYFNAPSVYIFSFVCDLIFRMLFISKESEKILLQYCKYLVKINCYDYKVKDMIINYLGSKKFYEDFDTFKKEVIGNWNSIHKNYMNCCEILNEHIEDYTNLEGGFNFCLKFHESQFYDQIDFSTTILERTNMFLAPEACYDRIYSKNENYYVRLSVSTTEQENIERMKCLKKGLQTL